MSAPRPEHRLAAVLSTDAVGYSRLVSRDDVLASRRMGESRERIAAQVDSHGGRVVDAVGDNLLAEFASVTDAVRCAVAIQGELGKRNAEVPGEARLPFRIGIESGDVLVEGRRIAGESVNVAARLESLAPVGGLAVSGTVRAQIAGRVDLMFEDLGERRLHNIPRPVRVFRAELGGGEIADGAVEGNLPESRTSFVGREQARTELLGLVTTERLLTLTGLGGAGKTRLALQVARDAAPTFDGGAWWVELQALSEADQVASAIANLVAGSGGPPGTAGGGTAEDRVARAIGKRRTLVVLDNCEHLVDACATLVDALLSRCTMLTVLATSREPLEIPGERVWQVAPLEVPTDDIRLDDARSCEAIALFCDRARSARSDFSLSDENLAAVQQICAHLDGIPLAIELAAVRVRHLAPEEIARRLDDRFQLLVARRRRSERRHQTLQAALDWSHDLLDAPSRSLFRRLSVFPGRFSLAAIEGICCAPPVAAGDVLELLGGLVDRSFVTVNPAGGELRYRLLETVREYAARKLDEAEERSALRDRHVDWFVDLAERVSEQIFSGSRILTVWGGDAMIAETELLDDFLAATEWALQRETPPPALLPITTTALLRAMGRAAEAIALVRRVDVSGMDDRERALLTMGVAEAFTHLGEFGAAYQELETVVELATDAGLGGLLVAALGSMLVASTVAGKEPAPLASRLMRAATAMDAPEFIAYAEELVGASFLVEGRFAEASRYLSSSVAHHPLRPTIAHGYSIVAALLAGDDEAASKAARAAMELDPPATAITRSNYGWNPLRGIALWHAWCGEQEAARRVESRALAFQAAMPMPLADADHLVTLGALACFDGAPDRAALLLGAARRSMGEFSSWRGHDAGPLYLHFRRRCQEALGVDEAERLRREGLASDPEGVLAEERARLAGS